ncbi:short-chain dehydrogenase [Streptomyces sp. WM6373]|uniref:oxidoreductase n=1 Tax=Streptomyces TaxID=1883 RepID=UPI0006AE2F31|nr:MULTISPECIES: oxidoreductase [unclassified Streptomyces]KOU33707.1 short-chain dehydrogenase [Streptomyces sp. WM6373]KOU70253.1 short-chain dehydrogenase [Streptomyces sp. XY66]KOU72135.1 short-chain dehydrogenase [Streptomyces sp. IGB124]KOU85957.1 short-chain dehydrogenase [Streptomyces sp. XY58]KOV09335.1 short-chain dehydrogenase [Streptomyces sp. XY37]
MPGWNATHIPDQSGRTAVVTGANSGIGHVTARELARRGASVVLACRSAARGRAAVVRLRAEVPGAEVEFIPLDLADLTSVREFATACGERHPSLDLLVNNAGVMALPYGRTADGFETQFGVNHLGHFALTGLLLPRLRAAGAGARIVNVSSGFHVLGKVGFGVDGPLETGGFGGPGAEHGYRRWVAYGRSKTANLLFTHELGRRFAAAGSTITAAAAHPGYAASNLHAGAAALEGPTLISRAAAVGNAVLAQPTASGALPTLYAATAPGIGQDAFIGPRFGWRGAPAPSWRAGWTLDDTAGERLWAASEKLTGVSYASLPR